jgi:peptide/nickel transport system ATP-binding protein
MPQLKNIPAGCAFNPRCPHAFARCFVEKPDLVPVDHSRVACFLFDENKAENAA